MMARLNFSDGFYIDKENHRVPNNEINHCKRVSDDHIIKSMHHQSIYQYW